MSLNIRNTAAQQAVKEASMGYGVGDVNLVASEAGRFPSVYFLMCLQKLRPGGMEYFIKKIIIHSTPRASV